MAQSETTYPLLILILLIPSGRMHAQEIQELPLLKGSAMRLDGTSNKSDWSVEVTDMVGMLWLAVEENGFTPDSVFVATESEKMKSGVSPIMDRLMYRALKSTEHPDIVYTLGSTGIGKATDGDTLRWQTTGTLNLAGVRDTLYALVTGFEESPGRYVFTGSHRMSMREHGITPPTAMFGALHTSEWVRIQFRLVFGR